MNEIFAERFKSARILNGFSLQDLSDRLGNEVSRQALHKYEKGEVLPDSHMVSLLAKNLHVTADFFFRDTVIQIGNIEFRKLSKLPVKDEAKIVELVKDMLSRYLELEEILGIRTDFDNPLKHIKKIHSPKDIEIAAEELRKNWELGEGPLANCIALLEDKQIKVVEIEAGDQYDGMQTCVNGSIPVIALNTCVLKSADRKRFTALHELFHLAAPLGGLPEKEKENYCHRFAAAVLMPQKVLEDAIGKSRTKLSVHELGELKKQYGISIQAIVMRARDIGIVSETYTRQFFAMVRQGQWRVKEPVEYVGEEKSGRFERLLFRALSEEIISFSKAASLANQSLADFRGKNFVF